MKQVSVFVSVCLALRAFALPEVSNAVLGQTAQKEASVSFSLSSAPAIVTIDIQTNASKTATSDDIGWVSIGAENYSTLTGATGMVVAEAGDHTIAWNPHAAWPDQRPAATRAVVRAWETNAVHWATNTAFWKKIADEKEAAEEAEELRRHPLYMVLDLDASAGANVTYYTSTNELPGGIDSDDYRTTKILFRKVRAKGKAILSGAPAAEIGRRNTGGGENQHYVRFTKDFYLGVFEVTQKQYVNVFGSNPSVFQKGEETVWGTRPVENVHFTHWGNTAQAAQKHHLRQPDAWPGESEEAGHADSDTTSFFYALRAKTGLGVWLDLPTHSQWEFACRAGTTSALYTGEELSSADLTTEHAELTGIARYYGNSGAADAPTDATATTTETATARVGSYAPNPWGFYDMYGNVAELCLDYWNTQTANTEETAYVDFRGGEKYNGSTVGTSAYNGHCTCGGSWRSSNAETGLRSAANVAAKFDSELNPLNNTGSQGFRLCFTIAD